MVDKMTEKYFFLTKNRQNNWPVKRNFLWIKMMKWITRQRKKFWFYDICLCFIFNYQLHTQTVLRNVFWIRYVGLPSPAYDSIFGRVWKRIFLKWTTFFVSRLKQLTKNRISTSCRWMKMRCCHRHCRVKIWSWDQSWR